MDSDNVDVPDMLIGPYSIINPQELTLSPEATLGSGGLGTVYRGIWNGALVAVKQLSASATRKQPSDDQVNRNQLLLVVTLV